MDVAKHREKFLHQLELETFKCPLCEDEVSKKNTYVHLKVCIAIYEEVHHLTSTLKLPSKTKFIEDESSSDSTDSESENEKDGPARTCDLSPACCPKPDKLTNKSISIIFNNNKFFNICKFQHLKSIVIPDGIDNPPDIWKEIEIAMTSNEWLPSDKTNCYQCKIEIKKFIGIWCPKTKNAKHVFCSIKCFQTTANVTKQGQWQACAASPNVNLLTAAMPSRKRGSKTTKTSKNKKQSTLKKN
jgi:hypothetical protein